MRRGGGLVSLTGNPGGQALAEKVLALACRQPQSCLASSDDISLGPFMQACRSPTPPAIHLFPARERAWVILKRGLAAVKISGLLEGIGRLE
jgi:hypothetical protein